MLNKSRAGRTSTVCNGSGNRQQAKRTPALGMAGTSCQSSGVECNSNSPCAFCDALGRFEARDAACNDFVQLCSRLCQHGDICESICGACSEPASDASTCRTSQPETSRRIRTQFALANGCVSTAADGLRIGGTLREAATQSAAPSPPSPFGKTRTLRPFELVLYSFGALAVPLALLVVVALAVIRRRRLRRTVPSAPPGRPQPHPAHEHSPTRHSPSTSRLVAQTGGSCSARRLLATTYRLHGDLELRDAGASRRETS